MSRASSRPCGAWGTWCGDEPALANAIALGALAAIAVTVASAGAYVATRDQLRESLDRALRVSTADIGRGPDDDPGGPDSGDDGPDDGDAIDGVGARPPEALFSPAVTAQLVASDGTVPGRVAMLERAISNLVDNAHEYGPPGAPIEIVTTTSSVRVVDHGPGVPATEWALVFERFWRADTARNLPGSGLGLAIVRQVVDRHGGTVTVTDTPGGGATFTIDLPPD